jgi:hypothetical protein
MSAASTTAPRRKAAYRLKAPVVPEHPLQAQFARMLTVEIAPPGKVSAAGVVWWSIDHANYAGEIPGIRIGRGIVAGIPDTFLLHRGRAHFVEIKTTDGRLSDAQMSLVTAILAAGGRAHAVTCAEQLLDALDGWGIPRANRVKL